MEGFFLLLPNFRKVLLEKLIIHAIAWDERQLWNTSLLSWFIILSVKNSTLLRSYLLEPYFVNYRMHLKEFYTAIAGIVS